MEVKDGNQNLKNVEKEKISNKSIKNKLHILIIAAIIIVSIIAIFSLSQKNKATITTRSTLEKVMEISDLSTIEYTYNAIVTKFKDDTVEDMKDKKDKSNVEYYVSYEGKVNAGIDFKDISVSIVDKTISIKLPEAKINNTDVVYESMEYIYVDKPQENTSISQEAYKLCQNDLSIRAANEKDMLDNAKDNAKSAVEALLKPWIESISDTYKVEIE